MIALLIPDLMGCTLSCPGCPYTRTRRLRSWESSGSRIGLYSSRASPSPCDLMLVQMIIVAQRALVNRRPATVEGPQGVLKLVSYWLHTGSISVSYPFQPGVLSESPLHGLPSFSWAVLIPSHGASHSLIYTQFHRV